jgi:hypothetical protein
MITDTTRGARPLPQLRGYEPHTVVKKPDGLDWDALTPACPNCGVKSGTVAGGICQHCDPVRLAAEAEAAATARADKVSPRVSYDPTTCDVCGTTYTPRRRNQKACSPTCSRALRAVPTPAGPRPTAVCDQCGNTFPQKHGHQRLCGDACRRLARRQRDQAATVRTILDPIPCQQCGTEFTPPRRDSRFCSKQCTFRNRNELMKKPVQMVPCHHCGTVFQGRTSRARFCSRHCSIQHKVAAKRVDHNHRPCDRCGTVFRPHNNRHRFCTDDCKRLALNATRRQERANTRPAAA